MSALQQLVKKLEETLNVLEVANDLLFSFIFKQGRLLLVWQGQFIQIDVWSAIWGWICLVEDNFSSIEVATTLIFQFWPLFLEVEFPLLLLNFQAFDSHLNEIIVAGPEGLPVLSNIRYDAVDQDQCLLAKKDEVFKVNFLILEIGLANSG